MTAGEMTLTSKSIEEVFTEIKEQRMNIDEFRAWLALWSVKISELYK